MSRDARDGSVLIVVLWACLGLVSVALLFGNSMLMTYRGADNDLAGRQAEQAIEGVARYAETLMSEVTNPGDFPDVTTYASEEVSIGEATAWMLGRDTQGGTGTNPVRVYGLVDEAGKLNLNTATVAMLKLLPGMTDELAASIKDWRDPDDDIESGGAESETYQRRQPAYACKNAPFESVEELALVQGATREILYGEDANMNGVLDPNEDDGNRSLPADNADGKLDLGILNDVTVFSAEPTLDATGAARINIAAIPAPPELWTKVEEVLGAQVTQQIQRRIPQTTALRSVLQFYILSELSASDFAKISGFLTASSATAARSFINVNTASERVLACVLTADQAAAVVSARGNRAQDNTSIEWLKRALGENAATLVKDLTIWTNQVSVDVAAVGRNGRGYRRARFVVDTGTGTPRIIYRRDLSPLGWALGSEVRQTFAPRKESR